MSLVRHSDAERLVDALDREIRARGYGAVTEASAAVGRERSWWNQVMRAGDLKVSQLLGLLRHLGRHPALFLRRVLGSPGGWEVDRPRGEEPELVAAAWERLRERDGKRGSGGETPPTGTVTERYLETLDRQRYDQPEEVLSSAKWAVKRADPSLLPAILGVAGSAWRMRMDLDRAEHCLQAGMAMAEELEDDAALARLVQRLSYVLADRGDRERALRMAERAAVLFVRVEDEVGLAKATVDQGIWLYYLGRYGASIRSCRAGLGRLGEDAPPESRCGALQVLAMSHLELGEPEEALEYLDEAQELAASPAMGKLCRTKVSWTRALALVELDELDRAIEILEVVVEAYCEVHAGEAARATCDLVRGLLLAERPADAYRAAQRMLPLMEPLKDHGVVSAAIADLMRGGEKALTLALVERVREQIESEREDRLKWRTLSLDG